MSLSFENFKALVKVTSGLSMQQVTECSCNSDPPSTTSWVKWMNEKSQWLNMFLNDAVLHSHWWGREPAMVVVEPYIICIQIVPKYPLQHPIGKHPKVIHVRCGNSNPEESVNDFVFLLRTDHFYAFGGEICAVLASNVRPSSSSTANFQLLNV